MKEQHFKNLRKNDLLSVKENNNNGPKLSKITIISEVIRCHAFLPEDGCLLHICFSLLAPCQGFPP